MDTLISIVMVAVCVVVLLDFFAPRGDLVVGNRITRTVNLRNGRSHRPGRQDSISSHGNLAREQLVIAAEMASINLQHESIRGTTV